MKSRIKMNRGKTELKVIYFSTRAGHLLLDKRKTFILDKRSFISVPAEVIYSWTSGRHSFLTKEVIIPVPAGSFTFEKRKSFIFDKKPSILVPAGGHLTFDKPRTCILGQKAINQGN